MSLDLAERRLLHSGTATPFSSTAGRPAISGINVITGGVPSDPGPAGRHSEDGHSDSIRFVRVCSDAIWVEKCRTNIPEYDGPGDATAAWHHCLPG